MKYLVDVEQWVQQIATVEVEVLDSAPDGYREAFAIIEAKSLAEEGGVDWSTNLARTRGWAASDARPAADPMPQPVYSKPFEIDGLLLVLTCGACPEQYEVFDRGVQVGYLRMRHGVFRVDVPECGGTTIYHASPKGDGEFEGDERRRYLTEAVRAIQAWRGKEVQP